MPGLSRFLPRSLVTRVYLLYLASLLLFVGSGVGLFYRYQFNQHIEEAQDSAIMLAEVATLVVSESAVIGDYDTIKRALDKALLRSQFATAQFIDLHGGIVQSTNPPQVKTYIPDWLEERIADQLYDINRNIVVGGVDYGVLRLKFQTRLIAADIWEMTKVALALAIGSLLGGLILIWFPIKRWLGTLEHLSQGKRATASSDKKTARELIDEVPLEFRHIFEMLADTSDSLSKELSSREKAMNSLRALLENMVPEVASHETGQHDDLEAITQIISDLVSEREIGRHALDNQKFALDQHAIVSITDLNGKIIYANDKFCASSGYQRAELLGQTHKLVGSGMHDQAFYAELWQCIRAGQVWQGELCNRNRQGQLLWYNSTIVPLSGPSGAIEQFIGISTDITRRKKAEAEAEAARTLAEQANRAKSEFLANMSHEIRTPMNGILGMTALALDTELSEEQRDYLSIVKSSSESLLTIINDILDFSKIEAGKLDIEQIAFDLPKLAQETLRTIGIRASEKHLELKLHLDEQLPPYLTSDPGRLRQVLLNLIGNAIKFTEQGEIELSLSKEIDSQQAAWMHCAVRDTGIGIAPEKQAHIFDAFTQEDASTSRRYGGTGLGLSISKRLIELMGGRMWLESKPGSGSTFHFTIPCLAAKAPENIVTPQTSALPASTEDQESERTSEVLLVEDNPINQRLALALLSRKNYSVTVANNGQEALNQFRSGRFTVILMDVQMPVMDGLDATQQIRAYELSSGLKRTPIIAMTANAMQGDRELCLETGMDDYLSKPIKAAELYATLAHWITPPQAQPKLTPQH